MKIFIGYDYTCNLNYVPDYIKSSLIGYTITDDPKEADVILFSATCACTAKQMGDTLTHISSVCSVKKPGAKVYVTGCITKGIANPRLNEAVKQILDRFVDEVVPFDNPNRLLHLIDSNRYQDTGARVGYREIFYDDGSSNLYISSGCNNRCTFCKVYYLDFPLQSVSFDEVIKWIDSLSMQGIGHIYLKGTNIAQYGYDLYHEYLLGELLKYIDKKYNIFAVDLIGYGFADGIRTGQDAIIKDMPKVKTISGGLESGSDRLLSLINKGYTAAQFLDFTNECTKYFKKELILNIISGFPTETEEDIDLTVQLLREIEPAVVQICQYSDSWFVPSHKYEQLSQEAKEAHTFEYIRKLTHYGISVRR